MGVNESGGLTDLIATGRPSGRLEGKVVIISGAGSAGPGWGNGRACAALFAREGAQVFGIDRDEAALAETAERMAAYGQLTGHLADATDSAAVRDAVERCASELGRVDVLVNVVGGSRPGGPVELDEDEWQRQLDLNLTSTFLTCKHAVPHLRSSGGGAIVNTSSTSGLRWTGSAQVAYAAAKAAVISFSRVTAVQLAPDRIRVNTVVPGQLHTPMVEARLAGQRTGGDIEALLAQRQARIPLGFMGDGQDTAHAVLFLASDEARFVTGTEIVVDGGMTARCD